MDSIFQVKRMSNPSETNVLNFLFLGQDTGFFNNLCLFTYFILHDQIYHGFGALAHQFQTILSEGNYTFKKQDFDDFFYMCDKYLCHMLTNASQELMTLKIILRMIGLLPIEKESFNRNCWPAKVFTNKIINHVLKNFNNLLKLVVETEWPLFKSGFSKFWCFDLLTLTDRFSCFDKNRLDFLHQVSDEIQRQDIANELLYQLHKLEQPVYANSNWTDLFTIVDPHKIEINHLSLTNSFETFIICITKISKVFTDYVHFEKEITTYFENRVLDGYMQSKFTK